MEKEMKKGFTLVELLAVIVILAIILAIAVPTISSILDTAKKSGFENNTKVLLRYLKNDYDIKTSSNTVLSDTFILFEDGNKKFYPLENTFDFSIQAKDGGIVRHSDGTITMAIHDGTNCITKLRTSNDITSTVTDKASCISNIIYKQANAPFTNLVTNGDFSNGTTGWNGAGASLSENQNILNVTASGTSDYSIARQSNVIGYSKKYYLKANARVTNSAAKKIYIRSGSSFLYYELLNPFIDTWYSLSCVGISSSYDNEIWIAHSYLNAATANGKTMEVQNVIALDLTATYGVGNEPTQNQMDHNLNKVWIDTANGNTPKKFTAGGWINY